jgi:hypothetical protein
MPHVVAQVAHIALGCWHRVLAEIHASNGAYLTGAGRGLVCDGVLARLIGRMTRLHEARPLLMRPACICLKLRCACAPGCSLC